MPFTLTITSTKPSGVEFFPQSSDANRALVQQINDWTKSCPGFISQTSTDSSPDTRVMTIVWDSVDHYLEWLSDRNSRNDQAARISYNQANGITSVMQENIS